MVNTRNAWIQVPDYSTFEIGGISREEIDRLWGSRWAQKCIRDVSEQVAAARFSPLPRRKNTDFCPPQLGFESNDATLAISPYLDVKPAILYGSPLQEFRAWTVFLHVKQGIRLFGLFPIDYAFEMVVSHDEALELVCIFYENDQPGLVEKVKTWKKRIGKCSAYTR
ncbi:hypothetical protein FACS1894189_3450 [Planctomycetales bacterium]|nr:hypothetical protein FACS1894189_3450 [Planctomycetales bacterium]